MRILSLDGGGYLGLATVAFLQAAEHHFKTTCHEQFDLFCGTSTGAIIALGLAAGKSAEEVRTLYEQFGPRVFANSPPGRRWLRMARGLVKSMYSSRPLQRALEEAFRIDGRDMTLGDILALKKTVLIPAFNITTGYPRVFKPDHAPELSLHNGYRVADVAMASAAAPIYLPVHPIEAPTSGAIEEFCDGGVFANHPAVLAYAEAISHLKVPSSGIQILSVSTPRTYVCKFELVRPWRKRAQLRRGFLQWRSDIAGTFIDATSHINDQTLRRLADPRTGSGLQYERFLLPRPPHTGLDIATARATQALVQVGADAAQSGPARKRLEPFFT